MGGLKRKNIGKNTGLKKADEDEDVDKEKKDETGTKDADAGKKCSPKKRGRQEMQTTPAETPKGASEKTASKEAGSKCFLIGIFRVWV